MGRLGPGSTQAKDRPMRGRVELHDCEFAPWHPVSVRAEEATCKCATGM